MESKQSSIENDTVDKEPNSNTHINLDLLKKMVERDSRVRILSENQRSYIASFTYGFKKINDFHEKHLVLYYTKLKDAGYNDKEN